MNDFTADISTVLISEAEIKQKLTSIFVDSIIIDSNLRIVVVSQNVLDFLEFNNDELRGKSINYISHDAAVDELLAQHLVKGYFEEVQVVVNSKGGKKIQLGISGFYLGLISEINGSIVLKVRNIDEVQMINDKLVAKQAELDKFIYRTAHDLRGPLATIKGLVNLLKMNQYDVETQQIIQFIDVHAEKLDEKLFKLLYMAQSDDEHTPSQGCLHIDVLEKNLQYTLQQNCQINSLTLQCISDQQHIEGLNEQLVTSLLNNVLLYFLSLPKAPEGNKITLHFNRGSHDLQIAITGEGFTASQTVREAIRINTSLYTDMLNYPYLMNFFAAQKVSARLNAHFKVNFYESSHQEVDILIPIESTQLLIF